MKPHLRVARPTDRLTDVLRFYRDGLGLELIASFEGHEGFDGIMLGHKGMPYHLEFTHHPAHPAGGAPTEENLLVFYLHEPSAWQAAVNRMLEHGYAPVPSLNPYWDRNGKTFSDPDGYRVVLQCAAWEN